MMRCAANVKLLLNWRFPTGPFNDSQTERDKIPTHLEGSTGAVFGLTVCWRVEPPAPEGLHRFLQCGRDAAPFTPIHSAPGPGTGFDACVCTARVCFRYNVCVDRLSAFFSWLSVEQSPTSGPPQHRHLVNPLLNGVVPASFGHGICFGNISDVRLPGCSSAERNCKNGRKKNPDMWTSELTTWM